MVIPGIFTCGDGPVAGAKNKVIEYRKLPDGGNGSLRNACKLPFGGARKELGGGWELPVRELTTTLTEGKLKSSWDKEYWSPTQWETFFQGILDARLDFKKEKSPSLGSQTSLLVGFLSLTGGSKRLLPFEIVCFFLTPSLGKKSIMKS